MTPAQLAHIRAKIRADIRPYPRGVFARAQRYTPQGPVAQRYTPPPGIVLSETRRDMLGQFEPDVRGKYYLGQPLASNDRVTKSTR